MQPLEERHQFAGTIIVGWPGTGEGVELPEHGLGVLLNWLGGG